MIASLLDQAISAVCPIYGVSIGKLADKGTWLIRFKPEATTEQRAAAQGVIDAFDINAVLNPDATAKETACKDYLNEAASISWHFDLRKALIAKAVSDEAYRLGKSPAQLTAQELNDLRQRIANIYKAL